MHWIWGLLIFALIYQVIGLWIASMPRDAYEGRLWKGLRVLFFWPALVDVASSTSRRTGPGLTKREWRWVAGFLLFMAAVYVLARIFHI